MKIAKIALFAALAGIMIFSSCKKKKDDPIPRTFSFDNTAGLVTELSWTVKDGSNTYSAGNLNVDLDLYVDDTLVSGNDYAASGSTSFETVTVPTAATAKTYYVGVRYFSNLIAPTNTYVVTYTLKFYPVGNVAAAQTYVGTYSAGPNSSKKNWKLSLVKSASGFKLTEI